MLPFSEWQRRCVASYAAAPVQTPAAAQCFDSYGQPILHGPGTGAERQRLEQDPGPRHERCFALDELDVCVRHNVYYLCELDQVCDVPTPDLEEVTVECATALEAIEGPGDPACAGIYYGALPPECSKLIDMKP